LCAGDMAMPSQKYFNLVLYGLKEMIIRD